MSATEKLKTIQSQIEAADAEIDEYGDKTDNAANPTSTDILSRMISRREGLEKKKIELIRVRLEEIAQDMSHLNTERENLSKELHELEQFHVKR